MKRDPWQVRVARRGYLWYLVLKIGKALVALPYFPVYLVVVALAGVLVGCVEAVKGCYSFAIEFAGCACGYWRKNWFKGFSREFYGSLRIYKPAPVAMQPTDAAQALPAQGEGDHG